MTDALLTDVCSCFPDIKKIQDDPSAHYWLKQTLATAIQQDSMDVAIDASVRALLLLATVPLAGERRPPAENVEELQPNEISRREPNSA